jgi:hypothetical protein
MKKYIKITLISFISLFFLSFISIEIYTEQMKQELIDNIVRDYFPFYYNSYTDENQILRPMHLSNFLNGNIDIQQTDDEEWDWSKDGVRLPIYKRNWRDVVAQNPNLLFAGWDLYGEGAILALNSKLNYYSKNKIDWSYDKYYNNSFNTTAFWKVQKAHHQKYNRLIDELLLLDDKKLNFFINSSEMYDDSLSYDFSVWLHDKKLLDQSYKHLYYPNNPEKPNNCYMYPGDLILLTKRISIDYPEWTPRKFLTECKRFNSKILNTIETIYPN